MTSCRIVNRCILGLLCHFIILVILILPLDVRLSVQLDRSPGHLDFDVTLLGVLQSPTTPSCCVHPQ